MTISNGQQATAEMSGQKLFRLTDDIMFSFAGTGYTAERARRFLELRIQEIATSVSTTEDLGDMVGAAMREYLDAGKRLNPMHEFDASLLLGIRHNERYDLIEFGQGFTPKFYGCQSFVATLGSGKPFADPFMAFLQKACGMYSLTVEQARVLAYFIVSYAVETNTGGVKGPIQLAYLGDDGDQWHLLPDKPDFSPYDAKIGSIYNGIKDAIFGSDEEVSAPPMPLPT